MTSACPVDATTGISWGFADTRKGGLALGPGVPAEP